MLFLFGQPGAHLLEQPGDLTDKAARRVIVELTHVFVWEEVVPQEWCVGECLDDAAHEARVAQVDEPTKACREYIH